MIAIQFGEAPTTSSLPGSIAIAPIAANAGVLLTRVEYLKHSEAKDFAVIDAAMNDLIRPSLYQAWMAIVPVDEQPQGTPGTYDLVGPICETGDFLGKQRALTLREGSLLAVRSAGAYGFTMSSNYNSRPRAPEVMVDGDRVHLVRKRETVQELFAGEALRITLDVNGRSHQVLVEPRWTLLYVLRERLGLRLHLWMCKNCRLFERQLGQLRKVLHKGWTQGELPTDVPLPTEAQERIRQRLRKHAGD